MPVVNVRHTLVMRSLLLSGSPKITFIFPHGFQKKLDIYHVRDVLLPGRRVQRAFRDTAARNSDETR
jgi:hypothetical protein